MARSIFYFTDSRTLGGAEHAMLMLAGALDRGAWAPTLLIEDAPGSEELLERARQLDLPVRLVPPMPLGPTGAKRVPELVRILRAERPSVFHAHLSWPLAAKYALAAAILARVPAVVATVQLIPEFELDRSSFWQLRALSAGIGRYIAVSQQIANELIERFRWPARKVDVVHNAVELERFGQEASSLLREELGGREGRPVVLTPARLHDQKGHSVLLRAAAEIPGAVFALAGEGPERGALEALSVEFGLEDRVVFLGHRTDIPALLAGADVFVLPSLYEGSSLAVLEAMAAGCPVVSSAIGGTEELVDDGVTGLLTPPGDPAALAGALRRLLGDAALRERLAAAARERVESGFGREKMVRRVTEIYAELLADGLESTTEAIPEERRNALLRAVDWRFLLRQADAPRAVDLATGRMAEALRLTFSVVQPGAGTADLAVLGFPRGAALTVARAALRPGGEAVCIWRLPRPGGPARARRALERAGFTGVRVYWPGPLPHRAPQFWLELDSPAAVGHLLSLRPPRSARQAALRAIWRVFAPIGLLSPLCVMASAPDAPAGVEAGQGGLGPLLPSGASWLLLTGGHRSINKVVGLAFAGEKAEPRVAVKFARVPEAEAGLGHEAEVLRALAEERSDVPGIPRLSGIGRRVGLIAMAEDPIEGASLLSTLTPATFGELAERVTRFLLELAGDRAAPRPSTEWWPRLVGQPLGELDGRFGKVLGASGIAQARRLLEGLGELPSVCEHRDCSPWNVVLTRSGAPALLDWESAELRGVPVLDLVYFLANSAFVLEGALESGRTRDVYRRLLDPSTTYGEIAARCLEHYCAQLGVDAAELRRLRLLCWIVHCRSEYRHLEMAAAGPPAPAALRGGVFLGLVQEELERGQDAR